MMIIHYKNQITFEQDGAPPHSQALVRYFFEETFFELGLGERPSEVAS